MKTILCFGDSNTWGFQPQGGRYPAAQRWPDQLGRLLGKEYAVYNEGACGRTLCGYDQPETDGPAALKQVLQRYPAVDLLILMLGTNDLMAPIVCTPQRLHDGLRQILQIPRRPTAILLAAPIAVRQIPDSGWPLQADAAALAAQFGEIYQAAARQYGIAFLAAADYAAPSAIDGIHLSAAGHAALAQAFCQQIRQKNLSDIR